MGTELHRLSPFNPPFAASAAAPTLNDCTLREGEQSSEAAFTADDRCEIASALAEAGIGRLQIALRKNDERANRAVVQAADGADTEVLVIAFMPDWREQIDVALEAGASHLNVIYRASPLLLELLGSSAEELVETSVAALTYAREQGGRTIYSPGDTMRAEWSTLESAYRAAVAAGAEAVYVLDTVGVASPAAIGDVVKRVVALIDVPVGIHAHNDLGLSLANALAAYEAGAQLIDTCINGMGDRCGNPPTDEVAVAMELLYGVSSGVRLDALSALSELVASSSRRPDSFDHAAVGTNAVLAQLDIDIRATLGYPFAFQPVDRSSSAALRARRRPQQWSAGAGHEARRAGPLRLQPRGQAGALLIIDQWPRPTSGV